MLLVAGVSVRNLVPRFWDPSDPHCIPGVRALMVSFRDFAGLPGSLRRVEKEGLRKFLGLPDGYQVFIDNGAFHSLTHNVPFDVRGYRTFLGRAEADWYPIPVEHIPHPSMKRRKQTNLYRKTMAYNRRYAPLGFVPIAHVGACLPQFLDCLKRMDANTKVDRLGLGAMVPFLLRSKGSEGRTRVVDAIIAVRRCLPNTRIHGFGIGGTATLHIAAVLRSIVTTTAEGFEYVYEFENLGDGVTAVWNSAKWDGFVAALSRQEREFPVKLRASKELLKVPVLSPRRPLFQRDELIVLSDDGREAFRMSTPAYIPK